MPNHVTTILRIEGNDELIGAVKSQLRGEKSLFDFNKVVPMPETYQKYDTTNHPNGDRLEVGKPFGWVDGAPIVTEEMVEEYKKATREQEMLYGVVGWYQWALRFWGTKWNCYEVEDLGDAIKFQTAWSFPRPVIVALSKKFPAVVFSYEYADEDAGYNTGEGSIQNGEFLEEFCPEGDSEAAWNLYFLTHEGMEEYYVRQEDGSYRYREDD